MSSDLPDQGGPADLAGFGAIVTGGGTGIGRAIAEMLAGSGAAVAITGRRPEPLHAVAETISATGRQAIAIIGDIASPRDCERVATEATRALGGLRILVNNAGVADAGNLADMTPETVDALIDIDLKGPIHLTRAALPHLQNPGAGATSAIINVSSSVTQHPVPGYSVYAAAKAGLDMLTRNWARELGSLGIRVNAVCPGVVRTPIHESRMDADSLATFLAAVGEQTPLGRTGESEDVARLVRFLVSPAASWITGAVIPIDGGLSLI